MTAQFGFGTPGASGVRVQAPPRRRTGHGIRRKAFRPSHLGAIQGLGRGEFSVFVSGCAGIPCIEPYGVSHLGQFSHCVAHVSPEVQRGMSLVGHVDKGSVSGLGALGTARDAHSRIDVPSSCRGDFIDVLVAVENAAGEDDEHRLPIGLVMGSVERALLMLTMSVGAASSSRASSPVSGGVTPGHAVTAASMFGKMLRRSSATATALTRELHGGLAVRLAEVNFSTAAAVARAGAPSPSAPQR